MTRVRRRFFGHGLAEAARTTATLLLGAALLCWPALRNGFPIVFADSGTYIGAFDGSFASLLRPHVDRPDWYSGVIALCAAGVSLWGVVVAQSVVAAGLLAALARRVAPARRHLAALAMCAASAAATPMPVLVSTLMPDIWLPLGLLAAALLSAFPATWLQRATWSLVVLVASLVSVSHAVILGATMTAVLLARAWLRAPLRGSLAALAVNLLAVLVLCTGTWLETGRFRPMPGSPLFMFARLASEGAFERVLPAYCRDRAERPVCRHMAEILRPHGVAFYLWTPMAAKIDGWNDAHGDLAALNRLAWRTEFPRLLARSALHSAQLLAMQSTDGMRRFYRGPYGIWSPPYVYIRERYPDALPAYLSALQQSASEESAATTVWLALGWLAAGAGLLYMTVVLVRPRQPRRSVEAATLAVFGVAASLANATVSATLSAVVVRYEARTAAIVLALVLAVGLLRRRITIDDV